MRDVVIVSGARTPMGSFGGSLKNIHAAKLGATAIKAALERGKVDANDVDECIMGSVLPAGQGQAPARQAAIYAGLPTKVECLTINKVCGSGLKAVMIADQAIKCNDADVIAAGGMENMNLAPYTMPALRYGGRMGPTQAEDLMVKDGLWDPYQDKHMGMFAELCVSEFGYTREAQDAFAIESYKRANRSIEEGIFKDEIVPVEIPGRKGAVTIFDTDEEPGRVRYDKIPSLRPAFKKDGTVTAANASSINDGAASVIVMSAEKAELLGVQGKFRIVGHASHANPPEWFTTAPVGAVKKVLEKTGISVGDIDLWEINEAFSVVALHTMKELGIDQSIVNVHGGAVSMGHPIGASGARILVTLMYAMEKHDKRYGLATLCIGGGEGNAMIIEKI